MPQNRANTIRTRWKAGSAGTFPCVEGHPRAYSVAEQSVEASRLDQRPPWIDIHLEDRSNMAVTGFERPRSSERRDATQVPSILRLQAWLSGL